MDQYPFLIDLTIIGMDIENFIQILRYNGYDNQANDAEQQFKDQLEDI